MILTLGLLLIPLVAVLNSDNAYAESVTVDQCPGASSADNDCAFVPTEVTIDVGDTVVWTNSDAATHTVTSGDIDDPSVWGELFDSGLAKPGTPFEYTFDEAGEYPYLCQLHPWMIGNVIVKSSESVSTDGVGSNGVITVTEGETNIDVPASLSNGSVREIDVDSDFTSIIIMVQTDEAEDGELMITLPRDLIDSKLNGDDDEFIIIVDGEESDYQELNTNDNERELTIAVFAGAEEVEIIGTQVVPEFPIAVMAVMGLIVATTVAMGRFNKPQWR
jgi:plastocyanin